MAAAQDTIAPLEQWAISIPAGSVGRIVGRGGSTIKGINETSGAKVNISRDGGDSRLVTAQGTPAQCCAGLAGVLVNLPEDGDAVTVQVSYPGAAANTAARVQAVLPALSGAPGITTSTVSEGGADGFTAVCLAGTVGAVGPVFAALSEAVFDTPHPFGKVFLVASLPWSSLGSLIGRGGCNAKELRALGASFDVPRKSGGEMGNAPVPFSLSQDAVESVQAKVASFLPSGVQATWAPAFQLGAGAGAAAAAAGEAAAASAAENRAARDALDTAVQPLLDALVEGTLVPPQEVVTALQSCPAGITPALTTKLLLAAGDAFAAAYRGSMGGVAEGGDLDMAALQTWFCDFTSVVGGEEGDACKAHPAVAAAALEGASGGPGGDTEALFFPSPDAHSRLVQALRRATSSLDIAVFSLTDNVIADTLVAAVARGVAVRLVSDDECSKAQGSDVLRLAAAGVPVRLDASPKYHMHHKFAVIDGRVVATGSYNWTMQAHTGNNENVLIVKDAAAVTAFQGEFGRLWAQCSPAQ